jgi:hypothetical protein
MYKDEKNEYGCPLHNQSGYDGVINFAATIDQLSPELRALFEAERAARQAELASYITTFDYPVYESSLDADCMVEHAPASLALALERLIARLLQKAEQLCARALIQHIFPSIVVNQ